MELAEKEQDLPQSWKLCPKYLGMLKHEGFPSLEIMCLAQILKKQPYIFIPPVLNVPLVSTRPRLTQQTENRDSTQ